MNMLVAEHGIFNFNFFLIFRSVFMFKVVGVSTQKGEAKVRFANDLTRVKILTKNGHTDIDLIELPEAMDKPAAVAFLKTTDMYSKSYAKSAIDAADAKYNSVKVTGAKVKPSLEAIKARANKEAVAE